MNGFTPPWGTILFRLTIMCLIALVSAAAICVWLVAPAAIWLAEPNIGWHWASFNFGIRYVLAGGIGGITVSTFITLCLWFKQTSKSRYSKTLVTISVIFGNCVFLFYGIKLIKLNFPWT